MKRRGLAASVAVAGALCVLTLALAGYNGYGPLAARLGVAVTHLQPQSVALLGEGGDPLTVMVMVTWPQDGFCSGQFTVTATETPTQVRVGSVESREYRGSSINCAGFGTIDGTAAAELQLREPLGERQVIRASDGAVLHVSAVSQGGAR